MGYDIEVAEALDEALFPGNTHAYDQLLAGLRKNKVTVFAGAGVSAPLYDTWNGALKRLESECEDRGLLIHVADKAALAEQIASDPLEAASSIEEIMTRSNFRSYISHYFASKNECTEAQKGIIQLAPKAICTLNYDDGLEVAVASLTSTFPHVGRGEDEAEITRWMQNEHINRKSISVMHLHGVTAHPDNMIFTSDDYERVYSNGPLKGFVEYLWRTESLLIVGFGFSDPFLTRIGEHTLRNLPSDNRHYALVGRKDGASVSPMMRAQFAKKFRCTPIFYRVRTAIDGVSPDHRDIITLLRSLKRSEVSSNPAETTSAFVSRAEVQVAAGVQTAMRELENNLYASPTGKTLYTEPKFLDPTKEDTFQEQRAPYISLAAIEDDSADYIIAAKPEFGATTLARKLHKDFIERGKHSFVRNARSMKPYKAKLLQEFPNAVKGLDKDAILILDDFDPQKNERLIKEVSGLAYFDRIFVIFKPSVHAMLADLTTSIAGREFKLVSLHHLDRSDIRTLTTQMFDSADEDMISAVVEKVYDDLLDLCIPLTPSNVIMYVSVLHREGDFYPLNRVQIMEQYIGVLLKGPSDAYHDAFNAKDKISVVSSFAYHLSSVSQFSFTETEWLDFSTNYMKDTLVSFDALGLLHELMRERIFAGWDGELYFKYRFYAVFFLGRHVANRPRLLERMLSTEAHLQIPSLIEVISSISADNSTLIEHLVSRVESALFEFEETYKLGDFDPFDSIEWPLNEKEEDSLWLPLSDKIAEGPLSTDEVDKLKTSLFAERRTEDQSVVYRKFDALEQRLVVNAHGLIEALVGSEVADGALKKRAMQAVINSYMIIYQIGLIFAPIIANRRYFFWHGIMFIGDKQEATTEKERERKATSAMLGMAYNVSSTLARNAGTKRLGEVFKAICSQKSSFMSLSVYSLLLRSKPKGWADSAEEIVRATGRNAFNMRNLLMSTSTQFFEEVNTGRDREHLKRMVALIRTKRNLKKDDPGSKVVGRVLARLEKNKAFERPRDEPSEDADASADAPKAE